jgi:alpha-amylase
MNRRHGLVLFVIFISVSCSVFSRDQDHDLTYSAEAGPDWKHDALRGSVFYEIFVRSFADSNGDGIGDLKGLVSRLDYLNDGKPETHTDLGVDGIWLMPVFESPIYHVYDTTDYKNIDSEYGTNEDFDFLLQEAHKRGIRVIVDFVMNHSSSKHPWFLDSSSSPGSGRRNWYVWRQENPRWTQPWGGNSQTWHPLNGSYYYGVFWSGMPDLNFRNKAVRKEFLNIAKHWLNKRVDGFRLDATRYLIESGGGPGQADIRETHAFLKKISTRVRRLNPEAILVGENWTDTPIIADYFGSAASVKGGDELPMNFNFPLADQIVQGANSENGTGIAAKIAEVQTEYPEGVIDTPFLTNHDQVRLATQLRNHNGKLRTAASILLTLPGIPFLYYGEEVGIQNGTAQEDEAKRTPMPWNATQGGGFTSGSPWYAFSPGRAAANVADQENKQTSLLSHYRNLIRARKNSSALRSDDIQLLSPKTGSFPVLAFTRSSPAEKVVAIHNLSDSFVTAGPYTIQAVRLDVLFTDGSPANPSGHSGRWTFAMPPHSSGVWRLQ